MWGKRKVYRGSQNIYAGSIWHQSRMIDLTQSYIYKGSKDIVLLSLFHRILPKLCFRIIQL